MGRRRRPRNGRRRVGKWRPEAKMRRFFVRKWVGVKMWVRDMMHPPCEACGGKCAEICVPCARDAWPNWLKLSNMRYCPDCVVGFDQTQTVCPRCASPHWALLSTILPRPEEGSGHRKSTKKEHKNRENGSKTVLLPFKGKSWADYGK